MTLTPGIDTYCTLPEANAYMDTLTFKDAWASSGDPAREAALKQACRLLNTLTWKGTRATQAQPLAWPRFGVVDRDGYEVDPTSIPAAIKDGQAELAFRLLQKDRAGDAKVPVKVGPLETSAKPRQVIPASVLELVREFRLGSGCIQMVRG